MAEVPPDAAQDAATNENMPNASEHLKQRRTGKVTFAQIRSITQRLSAAIHALAISPEISSQHQVFSLILSIHSAKQLICFVGRGITVVGSDRAAEGPQMSSHGCKRIL